MPNAKNMETQNEKIGKSLSSYKKSDKHKKQGFLSNAKNREKSTKLQKIWRLMQKWGNIKSKK